MGASSGEKESQSLPGRKQQGHARSSGFDEESTARSLCVGCWSDNDAKAPGTSDILVARGGGFLLYFYFSMRRRVILRRRRLAQRRRFAQAVRLLRQAGVLVEPVLRSAAADSFAAPADGLG